jgi:parallel beta-helix repeat protein
LRIPPGEYKLNEPLRIKTGDTTIEGVGAASHIINLNESGKPAILIEHPKYSDQPAPRQDRLWRVRVANLRLSGNPLSGSGLEARYVEEIFIQGVSSSYHGQHGLKLFNCYEDPRVSDNLFTYNKACGIHIEACHDIVVSANHFEENLTGLMCIDSFNLAMSGNNLDDHLGDGVIVENTYGSVIASNMIEECQGWGIILDRDVYGVTVAANVIAHEFRGGIDLRDAHGCTISANTFTIVKQVGIAVRKQSGSISITGNNFSDTWIGNGPDGSPLQRRGDTAQGGESNPNEAAGVVLDGCESIALVGNVFSRLTTAAVVEQGKCKEVIKQGNIERKR